MIGAPIGQGSVATNHGGWEQIRTGRICRSLPQADRLTLPRPMATLGVMSGFLPSPESLSWNWGNPLHYGARWCSPARTGWSRRLSGDGTLETCELAFIAMARCG